MNRRQTSLKFLAEFILGEQHYQASAHFERVLPRSYEPENRRCPSLLLMNILLLRVCCRFITTFFRIILSAIINASLSFDLSTHHYVNVKHPPQPARRDGKPIGYNGCRDPKTVLHWLLIHCKRGDLGIRSQLATASLPKSS